MFMTANDLHFLCRHLRKEWPKIRPWLCAQISKAYRQIGFAHALDPNDQRLFLSALYLVTRALRPRAILQTGTFVGHSTICLALALEHNRGKGGLITIDPEPERYGNNFNDLENPPNPVDYARKVIAISRLEHRVRFVRGYSVKPWDQTRQDLPEAPEMMLTQADSADLLVIDGDHTFQGVFWDLELGCRRLRPDGPRFIFLHDYTGIPEVQQATRFWWNLHSSEVRCRVWMRYSGFALLQCSVALVRKKAALPIPSTFEVKKPYGGLPDFKNDK